jgi:hypothetical protein
MLAQQTVAQLKTQMRGRDDGLTLTADGVVGLAGLHTDGYRHGAVG